MSVTDPISDYLIRIKNACRAKHLKVDIPASKLKLEITKILLEEGYIKDYTYLDDDKQGIIRVYIKYDNDMIPIIEDLKRISKPGRRVYANVENMPRVKNNLGIAILSTSKGVITNKRAANIKVGGEVLCYVW